MDLRVLAQAIVARLVKAGNSGERSVFRDPERAAR
jgi:hypothetical protein